MKTILQAIKDEIHYPVGSGHLENRLLARGLDGDEECTSDIVTSNAFKGAVADSLRLLLAAPSFSEADKSFTKADRESILAVMNALYVEIGEEDSTVEEPKVYVGRAVWQ